ncbi:MAG: hypothetical protein KDD37_06940 [Bdellovibrionales bacterium]|nr:hypothetical protein [Bdellovibrionales bacterium]
MEKLMNRIMQTGIIVLSLSGFIACSEIEAIKPKAHGKPTFTGEPKTACALDTSLLEDAKDLSLQAQSAKPVTLLRSTQILLNHYGVDLSCFTDAFTGPVFEVAEAKFS